ncbi:hypothetical protein ACLKA6_012089 [Drosophila palustris]
MITWMLEKLQKTQNKDVGSARPVACCVATCQHQSKPNSCHIHRTPNPLPTSTDLFSVNNIVVNPPAQQAEVVMRLTNAAIDVITGYLQQCISIGGASGEDQVTDGLPQSSDVRGQSYLCWVWANINGCKCF